MKKIFIIILIIISVYFVSDFFYNQAEIVQAPHENTEELITNSQGEEGVDAQQEPREPSQFACVGEYCDGSMSGDDPSTYTVVNIPLITDGGNIGCGAQLFFAPHVVSKTSAVLDATYELLFDIKGTPEIPADGFRNPIAEYTQLFYDRVTIDNEGTARVYLTGTMYGPGHCSLPEVREQMTAAALQFDTVSKAEVYLNEDLYNWCEQDQSNGEGPCPENPQYWVDSK